MKKINCVIIICLFFHFSATAKKPKSKVNNGPEYNIRELALPSEVENIKKAGGSIYYSPSVKGKVLIPVHIWGAIKNTGLHFVPLDTNIISGVSLAGGPTSNANLEDIRVTSSREGKRKDYNFDLSDGGTLELEDFRLKPGDTVYIPQDSFRADRAYYTGLIGVIATVLSSILLYREVKK